MTKYAGCCECNTIHYVVTKEEADALKKDGHLVLEFGDRNIAFCSRCGSKNDFFEISEENVERFSSGSLIQPLLLNDKIEK